MTAAKPWCALRPGDVLVVTGQQVLASYPTFGAPDLWSVVLSTPDGGAVVEARPLTELASIAPPAPSAIEAAVRLLLAFPGSEIIHE